MKNLKASNYITIDENGFINLTETGQEIADKIYERHTFLTGWLTSIGVDPKVAAEDACKMEHAISAESFSADNLHEIVTLKRLSTALMKRIHNNFMPQFFFFLYKRCLIFRQNFGEYSSTPTRFAIAAAVRSLSPVIITTFVMPASFNSRTASAASSRNV